MAFIGNQTTIQQYAPTISYLSGNGSTTAFTLPIAVVSAAQIIVTVENVIQNPAFAFSVSGTTLTFTSAPPSGTNNIWVEYTALQTNTIAPSQGTVQDSSFGSITKIPFVSGASIGAGNASIMKNRIINGAMVIDQRNAGASVTPTNTQYITDRWQARLTQASKYSAQQNAGSVTPPAGFVNYLGATSLSAYSVTASDYFALIQPIEGLNIGDLGWGTANAKTITLSAWVYSSLTGTFGGSISNYANTFSYPFTYSIPVANTWTQISITIVGPNASQGTWLTTNSVGIYVIFGLGVGSTGSGTANSWQSGFYWSATGATSVVGTNGATFYITGVQLEVGSSATGFEYRQYQQELALCQRYYQLRDSSVGICPNNTTQFSGTVPFGIDMRSAPSVGLTSALQITDTYTADYTQSSANIAINSGRVTVRAVNILCGNFTGLSQGRTYITNAGAGSITLSAEL